MSSAGRWKLEIALQLWQSVAGWLAGGWLGYCWRSGWRSGCIAQLVVARVAAVTGCHRASTWHAASLSGQVGIDAANGEVVSTRKG